MGVPFTTFMLLDLWANSKAAQGVVAFRHALEPVRAWPSWVVMPLAFVLALDLVGLALAARDRRDSTAALRGLGAVAVGLAAVRLAVFWRGLRVAGHTLEDARATLVAEASRTWHGIPGVAYLWILALGATAAFCARAAPSAVERWLGLEGLKSKRGVVLASALVAAIGFAVAGASVLTLATGLRPLVGEDSPCGTCASP